MRVGILTFHDIYNPGAFLQTMGTMTLLRSMGHDPVIIDYTAPSHRFNLPRILLHSWKIWFRPRVIFELAGRSRAFKKAQGTLLPMTPFLETHGDVSTQKFDAVLIGADVVWDYVQAHLGKDPVYFGAHLNAAKKISFAASCGNVSSDQTPPPYVVDGLGSLSAISVRDVNTQQVVKKYARRDSVIICDPAFHLDSAEWAVPPARKDRYILVYAMPQFVSDELISQAKDYARRNGLKTVAVCYRQKWTDENHICIGPMEWLGYIQNAAAVVTNTFHGTVFSVKAGVPFVSSLNDAIRLKAATMIDKLGIQGRFLSSERTVGEILDEPWDVEQVHQCIELWRNEARDFLRQSLGM